jgi:hypothetical protein
MEVCRYNGGVYVKTGQFAAAFSSVPNEYRKHLALLQVRAFIWSSGLFVSTVRVWFWGVGLCSGGRALV